MEIPNEAAAVVEPKDVVMGACEEIAAGPLSPISELDLNDNVVAKENDDEVPPVYCSRFQNWSYILFGKIGLLSLIHI